MSVERSQNGLVVVDRSGITVYTVPGTDVKLPLRTGPVGQLLVAFAARWHREVEPLVTGWCWGWAVRTVRGSTTVISNHASASAADLNAPKHSLGTPATASFTTAQIATIRRILGDFQGAIRWGGDYSARADPMHIETVVSEAACALVLAKLAKPSPVTRPAPAPSPSAAAMEDDLMASIPLTLDASRTFQAAIGAEAGGGSQVAARGWVTFGSTFGPTTFTRVAALSAAGAVLQQWENVKVANNTNLAYPLPDGTRCLTVQGICDNAGTRPWASYWGQR